MTTVHEREKAPQRVAIAFTRFAAQGNRLFERRARRERPRLRLVPAARRRRRTSGSRCRRACRYPAFFGRDAVTAGWQAALLDRGDALDAALTKLGRACRATASTTGATRSLDAFRTRCARGPLALLESESVLGLLRRLRESADVRDRAGEPVRVDRRAAIASSATGTRRAAFSTGRATYGDADRDGYLEYQTRSSKGTKNQGWKDSGDAIIYDDGAPVPAPIATCELQGYWYVAQQLMALLSLVMGARGDADGVLAERAPALKARFNRDWWVEDEQFFALALDPDKRQVRAVTSNVGSLPGLAASSIAIICRPSSAGCSRPTCSAAGASARCPRRTPSTTR